MRACRVGASPPSSRAATSRSICLRASSRRLELRLCGDHDLSAERYINENEARLIVSGQLQTALADDARLLSCRQARIVDSQAAFRHIDERAAPVRQLVIARMVGVELRHVNRRVR